MTKFVYRVYDWQHVPKRKPGRWLRMKVRVKL
jgi:hypothetical protein